MLLNKFPGGGVSIEAATAQPSHVLAPYTFFAGSDEAIQTGNIPSKGAQTYTPGTSNQTIAANQYLSAIQTIAGDANLVAANIKTGKTIFGVAGSAPALPTSIAAGETTLLVILNLSITESGSYVDMQYMGFTVLKAGTYRIKWMSHRHGMSAVYSRLVRNGAEISGSYQMVTAVSQLSTIDVYLNAGDIVKVQAYTSSPGGGTNAVVSSLRVSISAPALQAEISSAIV